MEKKRTPFTSRQWIVLATVMIASFLGRLDGTIVNLAVPHIMSAFGISISQASWISTAYIIAAAVFVPIFGKLGDLIGRKPLYLFGIVGFVIASALAGLSFNFPSLIIFRILQAITVSIDYPLALSILAFEFTDLNQRGVAMGMWSAVFAMASIFGPLLGGPLIDIFSWRAVFYVNIPLGAIGTFMAWRFIEEPVTKIKGVKDFDVSGSLLLAVTLGTLVLVLNQGQVWGWVSTYSILCYTVTLIALITFLITEHHHKEPVVDLKFFKIPTFTAAIVTSFISFMGMIGGIFLIPIFVQTYLGYSVTKSGYLFIPMAVGLMIAAQIGARLSEIIQSRYIVAFGMFWSAIAMYTFTGIDIRWTFFDMAIRLFIFAFGLGLGLSSLTRAATSTIPISQVGVASSILALARNISGAFGIAIFTTILTDSTTSSMLALQTHSVINTHNPLVLQQIFGLMAVKANVVAYTIVFKASVIFMFIGAISALFVKEGETHKGLSKASQMMEI